MSMPTGQEFMAPVLDGRAVRRRELYVLVANSVPLAKDQRVEWLASGQVKCNWIGWATSCLSRAGPLRWPGLSPTAG